LRHPRQIEHGCSSGLFRRHRPHDWHHLRSNHRAGRPLHHPALPRTPAAHPLPGRRNGKEAGVPHQSVRVAGYHHRRALQKPLASRTVLQMDQAALADQTLLGTSENAVKTQIWIAVSVYVLVAIVKKRLELDASLYTLLQIFSVTLFEKIYLKQALTI